MKHNDDFIMCHVSVDGDGEDREASLMPWKQLVSISAGDEKSKQIFIQGSNFSIFSSSNFPIISKLY